jgi:hypothetical protein
VGKLVDQVLSAMTMLHFWTSHSRIAKAGIVSCAILGCRFLAAQELMPASGPGGGVRLFTSDAAILEAQDTRKDLPCNVTSVKPQLGFDLKFHSGYEVSVPLKELAGSENTLTMVFKVTADGKPDDPVYFSQRLGVPAIEENAGGSSVLTGTFDVGEGKYHVSWLMRDRAERVCSSNWDIEAALPGKDKQMALDIQPGAIQVFESQPFKQELAIDRGTPVDNPLNVKVVVNFAPQDANSATLQPLDVNALISILRNIARDPHIAKFSIVAFNMQEQRVIYRQEDASQIDFPALGKALSAVNLGTVDLKKLSQKHGDTEFLSGLITQELKQDGSHPDAVIFAGPKVILEEAIPQETLKQLTDVKPAVFYMNYSLNPQANPWRDAIGTAVKYLKGVEYTISRPRDVFFSWTDIMGRIVKLKFGKASLSNGFSQ